MINFKHNKSAFNKLKKQLDELADSAKKLDGTTVDFDVLFNSGFMNRYTKASTFDEFLLQGNFKVESKEDFEAIPDEVFDQYVSSVTNFSSWEQMLNTATDLYVKKKLNF